MEIYIRNIYNINYIHPFYYYNLRARLRAVAICIFVYSDTDCVEMIEYCVKIDAHYVNFKAQWAVKISLFPFFWHFANPSLQNAAPNVNKIKKKTNFC